MIGATDHELSPEFTGKIGRVPIANHGYAHDRVKEFMDHWLKGEDNALARGGRVRYFTIGRDEWRTADEWPLPRDRVQALLPAQRRARRRARRATVC